MSPKQRLPISICCLMLFAFGSQSTAQKLQPARSTFGVSSSASAFKDHADWFPMMASAGVTSVRLFPEWNGFETDAGTWRWDAGDALVKNAKANELEITGILMGSPPAAKAAHTFPMAYLERWSAYVAAVVGRYKGDIHYWEVWNEGNGGFNDGHHTTSDYAKLAAVTYAAVKKANPQAKVGLSVASFDAPYLHQTILAMAKAGTPNCFDFLCIHPYEIADGLAIVDGEVPYLWMVHSLRDILKKSAPERADAEIWISEVGCRIEKKKDYEITEPDAAKALAKVYTMALAQGIARVQWFEGRDPVGEDARFGLLRRDGIPRPSYVTLQEMTRLLGPTPKYYGWLALGKDGRGYGFVFENKEGPVLIAWMPNGMTDKTTTFSNRVSIRESVDGIWQSLDTNTRLELTDTPKFIQSIPATMLKSARANASKPFPWGGDHSNAKTVSFEPGSSKGIFQTGRTPCPTVKFPDGSSGIQVQGDINHPVSFYVHPSFASIHTREYFVRASVRRVAAGNVGTNLLYEIADSQGKSPYRNTEKWFGATADNGWQTNTWHVKDACFSKMWGNDFTLRPEQSIPFAIGKIEVSTEALK
jgi:polysaccharide biosynthesis protein PslG